MADTIAIAADARVTLTGLMAADTGTALNAATVTFTLKTAAGVAVPGGTGTLAYTPASAGNYAGVIDRAVTAALTAGARYVLEVTIAEPPYDDFRRLELWAAHRGAT